MHHTQFIALFLLHYFIDKISHKENSLLGINEWLNSRPEPKKHIANDFIINATTIPGETEIWVIDC